MAHAWTRRLQGVITMLLIVGGLGLLHPAPALAVSFVVTTAVDGGLGSLRAAIAGAEASPGPDTITFSLPGSGPWAINLGSTLPGITQPLTIQGPGTDLLAV